MLQIIVYGKIIIDTIELRGGAAVANVLGGGGPQAAFGARVWAPSVGLLSRAGVDLAPEHRATLKRAGIDTAGVALYDDLPTLSNTLMSYDEQEYMNRAGERGVMPHRPLWTALLERPLDLPPGYAAPRAVHLVTEYAGEPMVETARQLARAGAAFSLEPIIDHHGRTNCDEIRALLPEVAIATPDWPSASGMAGSDDPAAVLAYWSKLGPRLVAIRHGARGSYVWDAYSDRAWHISAVPITPVDPTGAGNAYGGGLCVGWIDGGDARAAGCHGAVSASFMVERVGLPPLDDALRELAGRRLSTAIETATAL